MKILQINTIAGTGSTGRIVMDIVDTLHGHNEECIVACAIDETTASDKKYVYRIGEGINPRYLHALFARFTDRSGFYSSRETRKLLKYIDEECFDIVHFHNLHGYYINLPLLFNYIKSNNIKCVWTLHDCWSFTGHCTYFDFCACEKWKTLCFDCPQKSKYPKSIMMDNSKRNFLEKKDLYENADITIVTPSKWLARVCKESFLKKHDIRTIYNGIDLEKFYPRDDSMLRKQYQLEEKFVVLAVCAGWSMKEVEVNRKGMSDILKLSEMLDDRFKVVMVGFDNEEAKKGLPSNIIGITKTKDIDELATWYSLGDVFVNPTREEVLGMVNVEALACGTPVITYNSGGSPETIDDNCGMIVNRGDVARLAIAVEKCQENRFISANCIRRAKLFEKSACYVQYYDLYQQIMNSK